MAAVSDVEKRLAAQKQSSRFTSDIQVSELTDSTGCSYLMESAFSEKLVMAMSSHVREIRGLSMADRGTHNNRAKNR